MLNDEIVDEVRTIRDAHAAKFGYNLRAIYADLKKSEAERNAAGHPFVSPSSQPPAPNFTGNWEQTTVSKFSEQKKQDNRGLSFILLFFTRVAPQAARS